MFIPGLNNVAAAYAALNASPAQRQSLPAVLANDADTVRISAAAQAMLAGSPSGQELAVQKRLDAIKLKPALERTPEETQYVAQNDTRFAEIKDKIAASGSESLTADEVDYLQKAAGFVNTMAELAPKERALYDELVAKGLHEAAGALLLVGMARIGMGGQQVTLPNGRSFDPTTTEVTADSLRHLFSHMFVDPDGNSGRHFEALASYLDQRQTAGSVAGRA